MFERFSKTLAGLFRSGRKKAPAKPLSARDQAVAQIRRNQDKVMTPQRAELIRNALEVQRAKKAILADLDDEQKQKLVAMALRAFLNEGRDGTAPDAAHAKGGAVKGGKAPATKAGSKSGAKSGVKTGTKTGAKPAAKGRAPVAGKGR